MGFRSGRRTAVTFVALAAVVSDGTRDPRQRRLWLCAAVLCGACVFGAVSCDPREDVLVGVSSAVPVRPPLRAPAGAKPHRVVINEVQLSNVFTAVDDRGGSPPWVELYNPGPDSVELEGCFLSDDATEPRRWKFPTRLLGAGGYVVIWLSGSQPNVVRPLSELRYAPTLVGPRDLWRYLVPKASATSLLSRWWRTDFDDGAFAQGIPPFGFGDGDDETVLPRGTLVVLTRRTFNVDAGNVPGGVLRVNYDDGFVAYLNDQRVASAQAPPGDVTARTRATSNHEASGFESFRLAPDVLRAGRNVLAIAGLNVSRRSTDMTLQAELGTVNADLHASFSVSKSGGGLVFTNADGETVDGLKVPGHARDHSFGRVAGRTDAGRTLGFFLSPTPGAANHNTSHTQSLADEVGYEPTSGLHTRPFHAVLRSKTGRVSVIRYATDGSVPTARSPAFKPPLLVKTSTVFRAATFIGDERASPVFTKSYVVGVDTDVPILSLSMEPVDYEMVHNTEQGRGRRWERQASLELIVPGGKTAVSCVVGLRLHGGDGRRGGFERKKSYRLYFRGAYGKRRLEYPLFGDEGPAVDKLVLRAGLDDSFFRRSRFSSRATYLRDELIRRLHRDMGGLAARGTWCVLYVNMRPRGFYNVVERIDDEFLTAHLESKGPWDIVKTHDDVASGDAEDWRRVVDLAKRGIQTDGQYRTFAEAVDLQSFTDYAILNLWAQNHDWPDNNWYAARSRAEGGKWFFLCWDAEFSAGLQPAGYGRDSLRRALSNRGSLKEILAALWMNDSFRRGFGKRAHEQLASVLEPSAVTQHIERLVAEARSGVAVEAALYRVPMESWLDNLDGLFRFARRRNRNFAQHVDRAVGRP